MDQQKALLSRQLFVTLGIVHQLTDDWLDKALIPHGITRSQLNVLSHFSHQPDRAQTISELASVMQMNQPGITKVINKLLDMDLVSAEKDKHDGRKKWISITEQGLLKLQQAFTSFEPELFSCFEEWDSEEIKNTLQSVSKLKQWLDNNRR
ncbi:MarR family winged helix-turn-helix transcriptional regulator [Vibrio sonorensis]|uniref:MarR family winged helix-turn-helix transcriptional regulator n=1 Tax=Vibrio sonorensis TaxID=1004316 RepID=UPI0008DAF1FA|nr:MarR family winged helix-turn-helix transcriptional regulator [Vibrio sonorensis]